MIRKTTHFLSKISSQEPGTYVDFLLSLCSELESSASQAMDQESRQGHSQFPMESMDLNRNHESQNCDTSTVLPSDLETTGMPPSFTPFWNWQDVMSGIPPSFEFGTGTFPGNLMTGNLDLPEDLELGHNSWIMPYLRNFRCTLQRLDFHCGLYMGNFTLFIGSMYPAEFPDILGGTIYSQLMSRLWWQCGTAGDLQIGVASSSPSLATGLNNVCFPHGPWSKVGIKGEFSSR